MKRATDKARCAMIRTSAYAMWLTISRTSMASVQRVLCSITLYFAKFSHPILRVLYSMSRLRNQQPLLQSWGRMHLWSWFYWRWVELYRSLLRSSIGIWSACISVSITWNNAPRACYCCLLAYLTLQTPRCGPAVNPWIQIATITGIPSEETEFESQSAH